MNHTVRRNVIAWNQSAIQRTHRLAKRAGSRLKRAALQRDINRLEANIQSLMANA